MSIKTRKEQAIEDATASLIMILSNSFRQSETADVAHKLFDIVGETSDTAHRLFGIVYDMGYDDGQEPWYLMQDKDTNWINDNSDEFSCIATGNLKGMMHLLFPVEK